MEAGRLRHRIDIEVPTQVQDATTGEITLTWGTHLASVPAAVEPLSVREYISAQQVQSEIVARITIRYRSGLNATMRIKHGSKIYSPVGFLPDNNSGLEYLTIACSEGVSEGD